jgi:hypothetical protein
MTATTRSKVERSKSTAAGSAEFLARRVARGSDVRQVSRAVQGQPYGCLAGSKISKTATRVSQDLHSNIKNSNDVKYNNNDTNSIESDNPIENLLHI